MPHGRGEHGEGQDAGGLLQDMLLSTAACETRAPNPPDCLLLSPFLTLQSVSWRHHWLLGLFGAL